jgi:hypothetical protein
MGSGIAQDPEGKTRKLIPVRVDACQLTGILAPIVYLDLIGLPENDARTALLGAFSIRNKPVSAPAFPSTRTPRSPGVPPTHPALSRSHRNYVRTRRGDPVEHGGKR